MLDITETEVVSREAFFTSITSEVRSENENIPVNVNWSSLLGYNIDDNLASHEDRKDGEPSSNTDDNESDQVQEVAFSLFAPTKKSNHLQSYVLPASPPPDVIDFLAEKTNGPKVRQFTEEDVAAAHETHRPISYYLTPPLEDDIGRAEQMEASAVSGENVVDASRQRWVGCEKPWKVIHLNIRTNPSISKKRQITTKVSGISEVVSLDLETDERKKRHRPSKKRRIILRKRRADDDKVMKNKVAQRAAQKNKKNPIKGGQPAAQVHRRTEEEDRAKKTRLNRLKKVRKKLKDKEKA